MAEHSRRAILAAPLLMAAAPAPSVFDFRLEALEGGPLALADFRGQALMVVNTASFCGYTPQYEGLQALHDRFAGRGFSVIGVPSNDFRQENTDAAKIREFCETVYGITFPMAGLTTLRGPRAHPLFAWLAARAGGPPRWNFHKYVVARDGLTVRAFPTSVAPANPMVVQAVEAALAPTALG
ncbi:glutathione peroxidase [Falsiroseomonas sp.]|uniref:glutathione peroxidase n=1 Tax=Falsiroseomonas sp. TaxID=2870721 RepID=UPI002717EA77|nr:glutathione peroxidase [Falsiroseomonas sp.]MDO9503262.1 glutathione peroxidase [Falsiroseomonas sp.]MDP3417614.1 glutathione peroxidase [Falsiroseomonas sp.]